MNLIETAGKLCAGPKSFPELIRKNSPLRALWHFFILVGLMGLLSAGINSCRINPEMATACREIFKVTGGFSLSEKGLFSLQTPGKEKRIHIIMSHNDLIFDYLPAGELTVKQLEETAEKAPMGIMALPKGLISWNLVPQEKDREIRFMVFPAAFFREMKDIRFGVRSSEELVKLLREDFTMKKGEKLSLRKTMPPFTCKDPEVISRSLGAISSLMFFFLFLGGTILFVLLTVFFFALVQRFRMRSITFGQNFTLMLYAAFPGVLAGTLYAVLELPFLDFQSVFLIVFFIFQLFACAEVYRDCQNGGSAGNAPN